MHAEIKMTASQIFIKLKKKKKKPHYHPEIKLQLGFCFRLRDIRHDFFWFLSLDVIVVRKELTIVVIVESRQDCFILYQGQ